MAAPHSTAIYLVPRKVSAPVTLEAFTSLDLSPDMQRLARWIMISMHSHQAGITPMLAGEAALIVQPHAEFRGRVWDEVQKQLDDMCDFVSLPQSASLVGNDEFTLSSSVRYTIQRVFLPLVIAACHQLQKSYLFTDDVQTHAINEAQYMAYARDLEKAICDLARGETSSVMIPSLFWKDRLHTLQMLSIKQKRFRQRPVPHTNLLESGIFWSLEPKIDLSRRNYRNEPISTPHVLEDHRRWRPGADGVMHTHRAEDLGRILMSELVNDPEVLMDRINNEGFLAVKRPPLLVRLRDLIVAAIFPPEVAALPSSTFVKTVWFNFAWELARLLQSNNMGRSELRWIEGDSWRRTQTSLLLMECLAQMPLHDDPTNPESEDGDSLVISKPRRLYAAFVNASEWFPSYLDLSEDAQVMDHLFTDDDTEVPLEEPMMPFRRWALKAWQEQRESSYWSLVDEGKPVFECCQEMQKLPVVFTDEPIKFEEYSHIHIMMFLPAKSSFNDLSSIPGIRFFKGARGMSVTRVPDTITGKDWQVSRFPQRGSLAQQSWPSDPEALAGELIAQWLDVIIKEMSHG